MNGRRVKRSSTLRVGDRVRVRKGANEYRVIVRGLSERRGPAKQAVELYSETSESIAAREALTYQRKAAPEYSFRDKGKPSKKERRLLRRLKGRPVD